MRVTRFARWLQELCMHREGEKCNRSDRFRNNCKDMHPFRKSPSSRIQDHTESRPIACRSVFGKENRNSSAKNSLFSAASELPTTKYLHVSDILRRTMSIVTAMFDLLNAEWTFQFLPNNAFLPYSRNIQHQHEMVMWQNRGIPRLTVVLYFHG